MDFAQYIVIPAKDRALAASLVEPMRMFGGAKGRFAMVLTEDDEIIAKLPLALEFHNDEYSAWGFTLTRSGTTIVHALFGENEESGASLDDNTLEGDLDALAAMFGVDRKKLDEVLEGQLPDVEKFADFLGFGLYPMTPYDVDRVLEDRKKQAAKKTTAAPKNSAKPAPKNSAKSAPKKSAKPAPKNSAKPAPKKSAKPAPKKR
ncbi:hypothetical protein BH09MYX1_BH09MYX1_02640 [soil metagenome]